MKFKQKWYAHEGWSVSQSPDADKSDEFLTCGGCGCCSSDDEAIAEKEAAELMAAAPEMLIALRKLNDAFIVSDEISEIIESLKHIQFEE